MDYHVNENNRGMLDMLNRIMKVLLSRPSFKNNVRLVLNNIDPDNAPELARTILWQDMEFIFGIVSALPAVANAFIQFANEIVTQLQENVTPDLINGFIESLVRDIDIETAIELKRRIHEIWEDIEPIISESLKHGIEAGHGSH
jgi:hypothetical protein